MANVNYTPTTNRVDHVAKPQIAADAAPSATDTLLVPQVPVSHLKVNATGGISLNSTTALQAGTIPGQLLFITAEGGALTIPDAAGTAFNAANLVLATAESGLLFWDSDESVWRCVQGASELRA